MDITGRTVNGYRIQSRIATGTTASVWKGIHTRGESLAALKVVHHDLAADKAVLANLQNEFDLCITLHHKGLPQYIDFGFWKGTPVLTTEFIDGRSLRTLTGSQGFTTELALDALRQLLEVTAFFHEKGIIHGNIKPENILVRSSDRIVKLIDLSYVEQSEQPSLLSRLLGFSRKPSGTPSFQAPEILRGAALSPASDVYALGVTFFFVLTGKLPYYGANSHEILKKQQKSPAPSLTEFLPGANPALDKIVKSMLFKGIEERPQDAKSVLRCLYDEGILEQPQEN